MVVAIPVPVHALRQPEPTQAKSGLEEQLRAGLEEKTLADAIKKLDLAVSTDPSASQPNMKLFIDRSRIAVNALAGIRLPADLAARIIAFQTEISSLEGGIIPRAVFHVERGDPIFSRDTHATGLRANRQTAKTNARDLRGNLNSLLRDLRRHARAHPPNPTSVGGLEEIGRSEVPAYRRALLLGGVGNIGRGHIAPMLSRDDFDIFFVDFNQSLIAAANERDFYTVTPVGRGESMTVRNFWGIDARDQDRVAAQGPRADWIFTTVGTENIIKLQDVVYQFIRDRITAGHLATLNIVFAENLPIDQPQIAALRQAVLDLSDGTMARYIRDRVNFIGAPPVEDFREYELDHVGWPGAVVSITVPPTLAKVQTDNPLDIPVEGGGPYELVVDGKEMKNTPVVPSGIRLVDNIRAAREKKLLIHNMGHAAFAYLAWVLGMEPAGNPALAIQRDPRIGRIVRRAMEESASGLLHRYPAEFTRAEMDHYLDELLERFSNVELNDTIERIARDPLRKLGKNDRLIGAAISAHEAGVKPEAILLAVTATIRYAVAQGVSDADLQAVKQQIQGLGFSLPQTDKEFRNTFDRLAGGLEERIETILLVGSDEDKMEQVRTIAEDVFPSADIQTLPLPLPPNVRFRLIDVAILAEFDEDAKQKLADAYNDGIIPHLIAPDHWDEELQDYQLREALVGFRDIGGLEETPEIRTYADIEAIHEAELRKAGVREAIQTWVAGQPDPRRIPSPSVFDFSGQQGIPADVVHLWLKRNRYFVDTGGTTLVWKKKASTGGLEETTTVKSRIIPVALENRVLILGPKALGILKAASYFQPTDVSAMPIVVVAENARQADNVRTWARDLFLSVEVVNASLPPYDGDVKKALEMTRGYYQNEKGMTPMVAETLDDLPEIARLLGVPESEVFARQVELEALQDLESRNL